MTWTERVGDFAATVALLLINLGRIVTLFVRVAATTLDRFVTNLAERSEAGITRNGTSARAWVGLPAAVAWGAAAIALRAASVVTVFLRQVAETGDDFLRALVEGGEGGAAPAPGVGPASGPTAPGVT
jgi:predicted small integral membrane protein